MRYNCWFWRISSTQLWGHFIPNKSPRSNIFELFLALTTCRFYYPRYPAPHTIILEPCKEETTEAAESLLIRYREILRKVRAVLENEDTLKEIMMKYDKHNESKQEYKENTVLRIKELLKVAGVENYNEYLRALGTSKTGYSVVQRRDLDEIYINSYNTEWLRAWNGNMDIQVELD